MIIALWVVNALLALAFLFAGAIKLFNSKQVIVDRGMRWAESFSPAAIKGIGGLQVLGALGLILPLVVGIAPILTPIAAIGLMITMALAIGIHVRLKESFVANIVLGGLALVSAILGFLVILG